MLKHIQLLDLLRNRGDQSQNELKFLFKPSEGDKNVLKMCEVKYVETAEGILIDLYYQKDFKIFKSKSSAVQYLDRKDYFSSAIVVIEKAYDGKDLIYEDGKSESKFFENVLYFHKFKDIFIESEIASYYDESNKKMIFLSATHGRLYISCTITWFEEFYDHDNDLENQFNTIQKKINEDDQFKDFLKESFVECVTNLSDEKTLLKSLEKIKHIVESASRNYELYRHKFSFAEFKKQLDEEKEKYFKEYQSYLSDFLSKTASMPIQLGVYIFLIDRFSKNLWHMIGISLLIIVWSCFTVFWARQILDNIKHLKSMFESDFSRLLQESGISQKDVKKDQDEIINRFDKSIKLTQWYWRFILFFTVICIVFLCFPFIFF